MRTALLVSPHLDDVAFSCGGTAAGLVRRGWRVVVATVFTRSVHPARGFALECQRDKGLPDDLDYMALRRTEDEAACALLGAQVMHLDLPEAPHRGYENARALFGAIREDDAVAPVTAAVGRTIAATAPDLVLAPQGCGGHVDHSVTIEAVLAVETAAAIGFYRDTPYVIRNAAARPHARVASRAPHEIVHVLHAADLAGKQDAASCYRSQLGFQFGGVDEARVSLAALAGREADGNGLAERLLGVTPALGELLAQ